MQLFIYRTTPFGQTRAGCRQNDFKCRHNPHMAPLDRQSRLRTGSNATSRAYHSQPEPSEGGVPQCEPGGILFHEVERRIRLGHTPNSREKGRQKSETHAKSFSNSQKARHFANHLVRILLEIFAEGRRCVPAVLDARIGAAVNLKVEDYYPSGKRLICRCMAQFG
jgi:hypothetical protein